MKNLYLSLLLILLSLAGNSQHLVPPIQNHTSVTYHGASQNWGISIDENGILYAANNEGLLSYDGQRWELFRLKNGGVIRSVHPYQGRIYTGSYKEFGYWKRDEKGRMTYTSLIGTLKESLPSEEYWEILDFNGAIYFRSFGSIYKYDDERVSLVTKVITNKMAVYKDQLLIAVGKKGLYFLQPNGNLKAMPGQDLLKGKRVLDIEVDKQKLYIGTKDRLFVYEGSNLRPFPNADLNRKLARFEFNHIMKIGSNDLLIATVRNGVLHHNLNTGQTTTYNRETGLQNNTILGMAEHNGTLWLGLDDGIDEIYLNSPIEFFTDHSGELGAVYDLALFKNKLYAASNTGVYKITDQEISMLPGAQGHSWNLEVLDQELYCNHNSGTFKINEDRFEAIDNRTGSFQILKTPAENKFLIGNYTGISVYDGSQDSVVVLDGLNFPVKTILLERPGIAWAEHANEGIFRIGLNETFTRTTFVNRIDQKGEMNRHRSRIFNINSQIAILKDNKWYRYNTFRDSLEIFTELKDFNNQVLLFEDEHGYWFSNKEGHGITYTNFRQTRITIGFAELDKRPVIGNEKIIRAGDSLYYLTLKDGFAKIDLNKLVSTQPHRSTPEPILKGISGTNSLYSLTGEVSIPFSDARKIKFLVGLPGAGAAELYYILEGTQEMKGVIQGGKLSFQNLPHGNYDLHIFAKDQQGETSGRKLISFTIDSPWYLSSPMKFVYLLILFLTAGFIYYLNHLKLKKHRILLEKQLEEQHRERIERLEKQRLQDEIMMKRKELANTTMMAAKKNEVLMDIQGELNKDRDKFSNQYRLKHIMTKINKAIQNKDEWQVFETNFKEVHEDFSKDLLEKYPNLTGKDLKLCSYLKMNLTSKEIAPLMGKSVRGVEVHRYRLRKKMELESEENLSSFLIKNI